MTETNKMHMVYVDALRILRTSLNKHANRKWWKRRIDNSHLPVEVFDLEVHSRILSKLHSSTKPENHILDGSDRFLVKLTYHEALILLLSDHYLNSYYHVTTNLIDLENFNYMINTFKIEIL